MLTITNHIGGGVIGQYFFWKIAAIVEISGVTALGFLIISVPG